MLFTLAARLGRTVAELRATLDTDEFTHWLAWLKLNPDLPPSL